MASKYFKLYKTVSSPMTHLRNIVSSAIGKKGKKSSTIKSVKPAVGSLTRRRKDTDEIMGARTKAGVKPNTRIGKTIKKVSSINDNIDAINKRRKGKMGGGFMGKRMGYKKGSKFPDLTGDGKVTFADILKGRGVINGKRDKKAVGGMIVKLGKAGKKFLKSKEGKEKLKEMDSKKGKEFTEKMLKKLKDAGFKGGGSTMSKVASDKTKAESKKYEKRAKAASKFVKNQGRKFGSIMREKYMR